MIASIQTEEDFKERFGFEFAYEVLNFVDEIDDKKRARFSSISQITKSKYLVRFKSYQFPGCEDYSLTIEVVHLNDRWNVSLLQKN